MEALAAIIIVALIVFGLIIYTSLSWGFVLMKFWIWFVAPVFPMLPVLTFWQSVGIMFVIGLFHGTHSTPKETDKTGDAVGALIRPWLALFAGWLIGTMFIF